VELPRGGWKSLERITAVDNDRIDLICWKHYGSRSGRVVELVLVANPGLAMTETLKAGQVINLPGIEPQTKEESLW
jgi:phage tail protein X